MVATVPTKDHRFKGRVSFVDSFGRGSHGFVIAGNVLALPGHHPAEHVVGVVDSFDRGRHAFVILGKLQELMFDLQRRFIVRYRAEFFGTSAIPGCGFAFLAHLVQPI